MDEVRNIISRGSNDIYNHITNTLDAGSYDVDSQETVMGKGDKRRPDQTTPEERDLRRKYATTKMTFDQFEIEYNKLMRQGKIKRSGRVVHEN